MTARRPWGAARRFSSCIGSPPDRFKLENLLPEADLLKILRLFHTAFQPNGGETWYRFLLLLAETWSETNEESLRKSASGFFSRILAR